MLCIDHIVAHHASWKQVSTSRSGSVQELRSRSVQELRSRSIQDLCSQLPYQFNRFRASVMALHSSPRRLIFVTAAMPHSCISSNILNTNKCEFAAREKNLPATETYMDYSSSLIPILLFFSNSSSLCFSL